MDDLRFDAWTRRRFGVAAGGFASALLGLAAVDDGLAKKKRKKKCKKSEKRCGKKCVKGTCCPGKACGENCECRRTVEGTTFCVRTDLLILCEQCNSSAECSAGLKCVLEDGCEGITALCEEGCGLE